MSDQKRHWKKHIHAAKEWLGKAEKSLDADNSLRSDLNVMLAQAELQRAKEAGEKKSFARNGRTFSAVMAALLLVAIGIWGGIFPQLSHSLPPEQKLPGAFAVQEQPVHAVPAALPAPMKPAEPATASSASLEAALPQPVLPVPAPDPKPQAAAATAAPEVPATKDAVLPATKVPTEKVQKLMREAGKTLRAQ